MVTPAKKQRRTRKAEFLAVIAVAFLALGLAWILISSLVGSSTTSSKTAAELKRLSLADITDGLDDEAGILGDDEVR